MLIEGEIKDVGVQLRPCIILNYLNKFKIRYINYILFMKLFKRVYSEYIDY